MNKNLIVNFLNNKTSLEDTKLVLEWLSRFENEDEVSAILKTSWEDSANHRADGNFDESKIFDLINNKIDLDPDYSYPTFSAKNKWYQILKVAAVITLMIGIGVVLYQPFLNTVELTDEINWVEKETAGAQRAMVTLRDGSKVIMNSKTKIRYTDNYGKKVREILLEGEAFFEVVKDPAHPFIVKTKNSITTALGTSFNIAAYQENEYSTISLAEGKVEVIRTNSLSGEIDAVFLEEGEEAWVGSNLSIVKKENFEANKVLSWKSGVLFFDNSSLEETIKILERWYDVKISLKGRVNSLALKGTGEFENENLENVLRVLSYSMNFKYKIDGKNVTIY